MASHATAATLTVRVDDGVGSLPDAVVSLHSDAARGLLRAGRAELDQRDSQFVPRVLAVAQGSGVTFPNSDKVRHHVYSFSSAKRFELPLYAGSPTTPVIFDTAGVVTLGCNIHDWMIAYIVVLDTPYFAQTDKNGYLTIDAPPGSYQLRAWHEGRDDQPWTTQKDIVLSAAGGNEVVSLKSTAAPVISPQSESAVEGPASSGEAHDP